MGARFRMSEKEAIERGIIKPPPPKPVIEQGVYRGTPKVVYVQSPRRRLSPELKAFLWIIAGWFIGFFMGIGFGAH